MTRKSNVSEFFVTSTGKQVSRRTLVKGAAGAGALAAAGSAVFAVPMVNAQEKSPVVFWTTHTDIGLEALKAIGENYNAQSDAYTVEVVQRPPAQVTDSSSLITAVRGGEGPDAYLLDRFIVAERAAQGLLQDFGPLMEAAGDNPDLTELWVDFAAAEATYAGTPYALPFDTDVRALFYNKGLLTEAGVDLAPYDSANGPMTFDAFAESIAAVDVDGGDNYERLGFVPYFGQGHHYTYGFSFFGEFMDWENCQVTPDNENVLKGMQWVQDYCNKYGTDKMYAFVQNAIKPGAPPTDSPFVQGRLGSMINGNWMFQQFATYQPDDDIGYTFIPVPAEGDESVTWAGGWSGVVPQGAKNTEGGYDFVKYLCGADGSRTYVEMNNNLPVLRELLEDTSLFTEDLMWFVENLFPTTKNRPPLPVGAKLWDEMQSAYEAIYLGTMDPASAMGQAKQNVQADIDGNGYCPIAAPGE
jgi:ABC-type glycerol-3-phosphate transport system substrate-binding protein